MTTKERLLQEIEECPEPLLNEVLDFLTFLKNKAPNETKEWPVELEDRLWGEKAERILKSSKIIGAEEFTRELEKIANVED